MIAALSEILPIPSPTKSEVSDGSQQAKLQGVAPNLLNSRDNSPTFDDLVAANLTSEQPDAEVMSADGPDPFMAIAGPVEPEHAGKDLPASGTSAPGSSEQKESAADPGDFRIFRDAFAAASPVDPAGTQSTGAEGTATEIVPSIAEEEPTEAPDTAGPSAKQMHLRDEIEQAPISKQASIAEPDSTQPDLSQSSSDSSHVASDEGETVTETVPSEPQENSAQQPIPTAFPIPARNLRADQPIEAAKRATSPQDKAATVAPSRLGPDQANEPKDFVEPKPVLVERQVETTKTLSASLPALSLSGSASAVSQSPLEPTQPSTPQNSTLPTAPIFQPNLNQQPTISELRVDGRIPAQIEQAIEALSVARDVGRASRPEVLVRHTDFGLVSMRLEAASGDLRATLSSRDPGFVPAIQSALNERAVAAPSESAASHNNPRGQDQSSAGQQNASLTGSTAGFGANYGSSPGSSQGGFQPRMAQQEDTSRSLVGDQQDSAKETSRSDGKGRGLFA